MLKEWFIFQKDHHVGPFSDEDVFRMFYEERIDKLTLLWKKGVENWKHLKDIDELYSILNYGDDFDEATERVKVDKEELKKIFTEETSYDESAEQKPEIKKEVLLEEKIESIISEAKETISLDQKDSIPDIPKQNEELLEVDQDEYIEATDEMDLESDSSDEQAVVEVVEVVESIERPLAHEVIQIDPTNLEKFEQTSDDSFEGKIARNNLLIGVRKLATAASVILILIAGFLFLNNKKNSVIFHNVSRKDYIKLEKTLEQKLIKGRKISIAFTNDKSSIWMTSNIKKDTFIYLTMTSIPERIISKNNITITSRAKLLKGVAHFKEINFVKGSNMLSGYYNMEINGFDITKEGKIIKFLKNKRLFTSFTQEYKDRFYLKKKFLLSKYLPSRFEEKLQKYRDKIKKKIAKPLLDILERYRTFFALVDLYDKLFRKHLEKIKRGKDIDRFKREYALKIAPIFQGMILDNNKLRVISVSKNDDGFSDYEDLHLFGKKMGLMVSDMFGYVRRKRKLSRSMKRAIIKMHKRKVLTLHRIIESKIKAINKRLEKIE